MADGENDTGPLTIDQAIDVFAKEPEQEEARAEDIEAKPDQEEAAPEAPEDDLTDEEILALEDEPADIAEEALPPPTSWAKEDHAAWAELPAAAQKVIAKREADRDKAVNEASAKAGRVAAEVKSLAENYEKLSTHMADRVAEAKAAWTQKWGNVDWVRVAREDPDYAVYKAQADEEREQILAYEARQKLAADEAKKASESARQTFLAEEFQRLADLAPELAGDQNASKREGVAKYLVDQGFAPELIMDISAAELTIAWKAQRWDDAQKAAKAQASLPRRPATPPRAIVPNGQASAVSPARRQEATLSARLTKTGAVDDAVNLLLARSQKAQKR